MAGLFRGKVKVQCLSVTMLSFSATAPSLLLGTMGQCHLRGSVSFSKYVSRYTLTIPRPILPPKGYPVAPQSLGEHLQKKRLDLGLTQEAAGKLIGVTGSTVWNWEHGTPPKSKHHFKITQFLGNTPAPKN